MTSTLLQANHPQANSALSDAIKNMIQQESWKQGMTAASFVHEGTPKTLGLNKDSTAVNNAAQESFGEESSDTPSKES